MTDRWALTATVRLHGEVVDEVRAAAGDPVLIGRRGELAVPVPAGLEHLAKVSWANPATLRILDGQGGTHLVGPGDRYEMAVGPMEIQVELTPVFRLRRTEPVAFAGSLALMMSVFAVSLLVGQVETLNRYRCDFYETSLFPESWRCPVSNQDPGSAINAEYLARLLRDDLEGEEEGVVEQETPVITHRSLKQEGYIPAGDSGPATEFGGAKEVAPKPVRATEANEIATPAAKPKVEKKLEAVDGPGTPIPEQVEEVVAEPDAVADASEELGLDEVEDDKPGEAPKEEKKGWGFRDWIDAETQEVNRMIRASKRRLRIDPDDPVALGILAYYEYLGQDYTAAEKTFDRIIELEPESSHGYNNKALVYKRLRQYDKEEGLYRVALALDPGDATAMNNLAVNLAHQGRHGEALALMKRLETELPGDPYSDLHRAKIYADMGQEQRALHFLEVALEGMKALDTLHHIEFRQDIRVDPSFSKLRRDRRFHAILQKYYGSDAPIRE